MNFDEDELYTPSETAKRMKCSESFLAKARVTGGGPRYIKVGRAVRYPGAGLIDYQKSRTRFSTSEDFKRRKDRPDDQKKEESEEGDKRGDPPRAKR